MLIFPARIRALGPVCALLAVCLLTAACSTPGHPVETHVDLSTLDVGDYDTEPLAEPSPGDGKYGRIIESERMGEAIIDPTEADPAAKFNLSVGIAALPTSDYAVRRLGDATKSVLDQQRLLAGFWVGGSDTKSDSAQIGRMHRLSVVLLRFPDETTAQAAATGIDAADLAVSPDNVAVTIPGYAAAHSHRRPDVPTLAATLAHGAFVISVLVQLPDTDLTALTDIAAKSFAAQLPALDRFQATPADKFATLALDRDGMLRRALPTKRGQWPVPAISSITGGGAANWDDPIVDTGVVFGPRVVYFKYGRFGGPGLPGADAFAKVGFGGVLRFTDVAAAHRYSFRTPDASQYEIVAAPAGVPDARCIKDISPAAVAEVRYACRVMVHRYVGMILSADLQDAQRRAAAQYMLLVKSDSN